LVVHAIFVADDKKTLILGISDNGLLFKKKYTLSFNASVEYFRTNKAQSLEPLLCNVRESMMLACTPSAVVGLDCVSITKRIYIYF